MGKQLRHRIHELFSEETLLKIEDIIMDPDMRDNNEKVTRLLFLLKDLGFSEIGPGTNRLCVRHMDYVFKIALDSFGISDNWNEFEMSPELQPYVSKTYECNGLVVVAEYVNLITKTEFLNSRDHIRNILSILSDNYIFCDMGTIEKNFLNFGYRDDGSLVILDYGYIYPLDPRIMFCKKCGGKIVWTVNYDKLTCTKCGKSHDPIEIRDRMRRSEDSFDKTAVPDDGKPLVIKLG